MMRIALAALVTMSFLGACSSSSKSSSYSVTPKVQVTVKGGKKSTARANYRQSPQESKLTGSAGSVK
jgi:hypothetical protein